MELQTSGEFAARDRELQQVVLELMEAAVSRRLGRGPEVSRASYKRITASVRRAAATRQEREDFLEQATEIAESSVDENWEAIEPLTQRGVRLSFRDLEHWPKALAERPLHPLPPVSNVMRDKPSSYEIGIKHRVAHGVIAAAFTGHLISVGFSGFTVPRRAIGETGLVQIMQAGNALELLLAGQIDPERHCECRVLTTACILDALGITGLSGIGTLGEQLTAIGQADLFHHYFVNRWNETEPLVKRGLDVGFIDVEATRLAAAGRITIDPVAAAAALDVALPAAVNASRWVAVTT